MRDVERRPLFLREARAIATQGLLIARGARRPPCRAQGERVAVFVHGFLAAGPVFDPLRAEVERHIGIPTVDFTYSPLSSFFDITARLANVLETRLERHCRVSLVGHSLGGLVARWWVQEMGGHARADRVVTLATPHAGTKLPRVAPVPVASVLRPGSPVLSRLAAGRDRARHLPHVAVVAGQDGMVTPPSSAAALEDAEVAWLDDLGHNEMLFDARVHEIVVRALR